MNKKDLSSDLIDIEEAFGSSPTVDREKGVVRGVQILTGNKRSANNTKYTDSALSEAVSRYDGAKAYLDHPEKAKRGENRSVRDLAGVYRNVRKEGSSVKADLHVMEAHQKTVFGIAEMRPKGTGLSIRDRGRGSEEKGTGVFLVEGFSGNNFSVDLVTEASVNEDLFESSRQGGADVDFKTLKIDDLKKERPDLVESIENSAKASLAAQVEEANKKGEKADAVLSQAQKLEAVCEAKLKPELHEMAKAAVSPGAVTLEEAKGVIAKFKEMNDKLSAAPAKGTGGDPKVKGAGGERKVEEGAGSGEELPSNEAFAAAFSR